MRKKSRPFRISQRAADGGIAVWIILLNGLSRVILKVTSRNRRAPDPLPEWAYMIVYDLSGHT